VKNLKTLKWAGVALGALIAVSIATQCVRPSHVAQADPGHTIQAQFAANGLDSVLVRACGDCHSNTMSSTGWYTRVPPFSTVLARGASEGRKAVNFAEWSAYTPEQQRAFLASSCVDAKSGRMPVPAYLRFRADATLSPRDIETICGATR